MHSRTALRRAHPAPFSLRSALSYLRAMVTVRRHRAALSRLDPHLLRDIGLTAQEAQEEAERPAWDVPDHWRR